MRRNRRQAVQPEQKIVSAIDPHLLQLQAQTARRLRDQQAAGVLFQLLWESPDSLPDPHLQSICRDARLWCLQAKPR